MIVSIKAFLSSKRISGDIILYRDTHHKKKSMCEYVANHLGIQAGIPVRVYSNGAFGLYIAMALPRNQVLVCGRAITSEYKNQIVQLANAKTIEEDDNTTVKNEIAKSNYFYLNQFDEPLIKEYYKKHFAEILAEVGTVDAFVDCGHSCATLAGAIESGANLQFVLGINRVDGERQNVHYLKDHKDKFTQETTRNFDTAVLQTEIEAAYPSFGNIYEATRSISAAMSWLQKNPNKTVLVYVGDSPVFGQDVSTNAL